MDIWAHTMVKNESRWLWYSVTSVADYVDKILLWDTGSTDGTLEICKALSEKYGNKIIFKQRPQESTAEFTDVRQEMLNETKSDWFLMVDGDEIWWKESIEKLTSEIRQKGKSTESIYVPTLNLVGDIYHYQDQSSGRYRFGEKVGHYNLRAINRNIPGIHSYGAHGVWGWVDRDGKMIQDRGSNKVVFVDAPYLHATFIPRGKNLSFDKEVVKRSKKLKYEIGRNFPLDFFYPESFFEEKPSFVQSPWQTMSESFKTRALIETPLRKIKRRFWKGPAGY